MTGFSTELNLKQTDWSPNEMFGVKNLNPNARAENSTAHDWCALDSFPYCPAGSVLRVDIADSSFSDKK